MSKGQHQARDISLSSSYQDRTWDCVEFMRRTSSNLMLASAEYRHWAGVYFAADCWWTYEDRCEGEDPSRPLDYPGAVVRDERRMRARKERRLKIMREWT